MTPRRLYVILPGYHMVEATPGMDTSTAIRHCHEFDTEWTDGPPGQQRQAAVKLKRGEGWQKAALFEGGA